MIRPRPPHAGLRAVVLVALAIAIVVGGWEHGTEERARVHLELETTSRASLCLQVLDEGRGAWPPAAVNLYGTRVRVSGPARVSLAVEPTNLASALRSELFTAPGFLDRIELETSGVLGAGAILEPGGAAHLGVGGGPDGAGEAATVTLLWPDGAVEGCELPSREAEGAGALPTPVVGVAAAGHRPQRARIDAVGRDAARVEEAFADGIELAPAANEAAPEVPVSDLSPPVVEPGRGVVGLPVRLDPPGATPPVRFALPRAAPGTLGVGGAAELRWRITDASGRLAVGEDPPRAFGPDRSIEVVGAPRSSAGTILGTRPGSGAGGAPGSRGRLVLDAVAEDVTVDGTSAMPRASRRLATWPFVSGLLALALWAGLELRALPVWWRERRLERWRP